jgi:predicted kinase
VGQPFLVVLAGLPGTGKTTLARRLAGSLGAAYLRVDAIETAVIRSGLAVAGQIGVVGYVVAQEITSANLAVGLPVVVDAVNPVAESRQAWPALVAPGRLIFFETVIPDRAEHRRRVEARLPDMAGQKVPGWQEVEDRPYTPWNEDTDGPRQVIDMTLTDRGVATAIEHLRGHGLWAARRPSGTRP